MTSWETERDERGMSTVQHRRRVGAVRPNHLMYTNEIDSLINLPNFSVLMRGLED